MARRKTLETFVPMSSKNSAFDSMRFDHVVSKIFVLPVMYSLTCRWGRCRRSSLRRRAAPAGPASPPSPQSSCPGSSSSAGSSSPPPEPKVINGFTPKQGLKKWWATCRTVPSYKSFPSTPLFCSSSRRQTFCILRRDSSPLFFVYCTV